MANENVKIVIKEVNESSPQGAGASSDIAYVPGFANDIIGYEDEAKTKAIYSTKNVPVLCNSIAEFEYHFGKDPYILEDKDVSLRVEDTLNGGYKYEGTGACNYNNYLAGSMDASYIYAKELINSGISVYYENIRMDETEIDEELALIAEDEESLRAATKKVTDATKALNTAVTAKNAAETELQNRLSATEGTDEERAAAIQAAREALDREIANVEKCEKNLADAEANLASLQESIGTSEDIKKEKASLEDKKAMGRIDYLYSVLSDRLSVLKECCLCGQHNHRKLGNQQ